MPRAVAILLLVIVALGAGWRVARPGSGDATRGRVVYVPDADTVDVRLDGAQTPVRVIGVDAPEVAHDGRPAACYGDRAGAFVRSALDGRRVRLVPGVERHDRYGRLLAAVIPVDGPLAGRDLAETLAREGLARSLAIPPNDANAAVIAGLVAEARAARRGLWSACGFHAAFPRVG